MLGWCMNTLAKSRTYASFASLTQHSPLVPPAWLHHFDGQHDWRSQKTPRVARSSLGAEAQGGGQACDALERVCVYWNCLLDPRRKLKELLDCKSTLEPTMITDAKALYDSFHREGYSSSVVDKQVSLEVKVMKERLLALGGNLRWMSSERQLADGLTKESARGLLAERLRYGKLKLIWDPTYKAAKKKTKDELKASLQESTFSSPPLDEPHQALPTAGTELLRMTPTPMACLSMRTTLNMSTWQSRMPQSLTCLRLVSMPW